MGGTTGGWYARCMTRLLLCALRDARPDSTLTSRLDGADERENSGCAESVNSLSVTAV